MNALFRSFVVTAALAALIIDCGAVRADPSDDATDVKKISFYVGTSPGAGYDLYARTFAEFAPRHIPGNPQIIVQYTVGAAGMTLANQIYNTLPSDGSTIAMSPASIVLSELLDPKSVRYRSKEFGWVGTLATTTDVLAVLKSSGVSSIEDARNKSIIVGAAGKVGNVNIYPSLSNALLGTKFKIVHGYAGGNEINMAMENGEVQGRTNQWDSWKAQRPNWIKEGKLSYLVQFGPKVPELDGVPRMDDLVTEPRQKLMVNMVEIIEVVGKSIFTSPKIAPARLAVLRKAFDQTMADPDYIARVKQLGLELTWRRGKELQADLDQTMSAPDDARSELIDTLDLH